MTDETLVPPASRERKDASRRNPSLVRRAFAARVIGFHFGATESAVVIRVRFLHDLVRDAVRAPVGDRFLFRHDPIVVCVPLFEIRGSTGITAGPFHQGQAAVVIRIARNKNFDDEKIARFVARQFSVVIRVGLAEGVASNGASGWL